MKSYIKFTALFLTEILILTVIAACAESPEKTGADSVNTAPVSDEGGKTEDLSYTDDLPESDYKGQAFRFLLYGDGVPKNWSVVDIIAEEINGEVINDAIIDRNRILEERFNIVIEGTYDMSAASTISNTVRAGDDAFDAVWLQMPAAGTAAQSGLFYSYNAIPNINLNKSYWDKSMIRDLSVGGEIYYLTGDISTIDNQATWMLMFNKNMVESYNLEEPYIPVNNGTWVIDTFATMVRDITMDIDGNGTFDKYDQYGLSTTADTVYGLFYSCGERIAAKDANDYPTFLLNQDKVSAILENTIKIMSKDSALVSGRITGSSDVILDVRNAFEEDRALFYAEVMFHIAMLRQMETDFGIIPMPKYDEAQENYITFVNPAATLVSVPITVINTEFAGVVLEGMASSSYKILTPAYYEIALKGKYARDDESDAMLDLLLVNRAYDLGLIYAWGGFASSYNALAITGENGLSSLVAKTEKTINKAVDKFIVAFDEMP